MKWVKKGLIYCASANDGWALSHAAMPTPHRLNDDVIRLYCAFRAEKNVSRIGYVDVLTDNPSEVIAVSPEPLLDIGQPGTFDDNGVIPVSIVKNGDALYLYYGGFELGVNVPYYLLGGLAISHDGGNTFTRHQQTPIIDRSDSELFFRTVSYVLKEGDVWKMWYIGGSRWIEHHGKKLPVYTVKYLESPDGVTWGAEGKACLELQGDEHGFGRPYVIKTASGYQMYYSIRSLSKGYRLGYAESADGKEWVRKDDQIGIDVSPGGLDDQMICYCSVLAHRDKTYLFYNGNNYGGTGICYAELDVQEPR